MTYKEFEKWAVDNGWKYEESYSVIIIRLGENSLATVSKHHQYKVSTNTYEFERLHRHAQHSLFEKVVKLASTPTGDRVEEERFHWRVKGWENTPVPEEYLYITDWEDGAYRETEQAFKTNRYTQKEYDKLVEQAIIADIFEKEEIAN